METNRVNAEKKHKKELKRQPGQEKKDQMERQRKENELRKNFQVRNQETLWSPASTTADKMASLLYLADMDDKKMHHLTKQGCYLQTGGLVVQTFETSVGRAKE